MPRFDPLPERRSDPQQVILPDNLGQLAWPKAIRQRSRCRIGKARRGKQIVARPCYRPILKVDTRPDRFVT